MYALVSACVSVCDFEKLLLTEIYIIIVIYLLLIFALVILVWELNNEKKTDKTKVFGIGF